MKYCPARLCPHRRRCGGPAEFEDRVIVCTDCGTYLVDDLAVAQAGTDPVPETAGYRDPAFRPPEEDIQARAQTDVTTGMALIGLSVAIPVISYVISFATGGGTYIVSIAPLLYGLYRLNRGLSARR